MTDSHGKIVYSLNTWMVDFYDVCIFVLKNCHTDSYCIIFVLLGRRLTISRSYMQHNSIDTFDSLVQQLPLHSGGIQQCYFVDRLLLFCSPKSQPCLVNLWLVMLVWHYGIWQWKWWWKRECTIDSSVSQSSRSVFCQWVVCWWASLCLVMLKSYDFLGWPRNVASYFGRPLGLVHPGFFRPNSRGWWLYTTICLESGTLHSQGYFRIAGLKYWL